MNLITNKKLTKTLMLIVVFVMIFTFILPNYSFAKSQDEKDGGKLSNIYKEFGFKTFARTGDIYLLF